ncbi:hypothetical protein LGV61_05435 [Desulfurispirillum indicum]|uniref:hypothetical protein n=1 Tax=Desulfurispirillum indicum TaxID=936456 RepID=UPI001CF97F2D|nr:hypothetical protein [Desulfurispirillum indicum]UCZ57718.1 hypothetical protein LGV61_05435 [Desulfurispirillum indicum]
MSSRNLIIQSGNIYQPMTMGISMVRERCEIGEVFVLTTFSLVPEIDKLLNRFFPDIPRRIFGMYVSAKGSASDQREYRKNVEKVLRLAGENPIAMIASGTNWMTWHFARYLGDMEAYTVRTRKEFQEKSFLPERDAVTVDPAGNVIHHEGQICELVPLNADCPRPRLDIQGRTIHFLDHHIELPMQQAAMYAFMVENGCHLDMREDYTQAFNDFCERSPQFDSYRSMLDEGKSFHERFKQNVSKINSHLRQCEEIVRLHLSIEKDEDAPVDVYRLGVLSDRVVEGWELEEPEA